MVRHKPKQCEWYAETIPQILASLHVSLICADHKGYGGPLRYFGGIFVGQRQPPSPDHAGTEEWASYMLFFSSSIAY